MKKTILLICLLITGVLYAQENFLSIKLSQGHPRYLTDNKGKAETQKLIKEEPWAQEVFEKLKQRTDRYADRGPEWLTSRLQMYWKTHATEVYIKGEYYDHAGGEKAPAPTVMYTGARSHATNYVRPAHIPFVIESKSALISRFCYAFERSRILGREHSCRVQCF